MQKALFCQFRIMDKIAIANLLCLYIAKKPPQEIPEAVSHILGMSYLPKFSSTESLLTFSKV